MGHSRHGWQRRQMPDYILSTASRTKVQSIVLAALLPDSKSPTISRCRSYKETKHKQSLEILAAKIAFFVNRGYYCVMGMLYPSYFVICLDPIMGRCTRPSGRRMVFGVENLAAC